MRNHMYTEIKRDLVKSAMEQKTPLLGHFELSARCNLDCKMCYVHTQDNAAALRKELSTEQWKRIFDEAYDCEMLYANLSGGECLIRKDFKELYLHLWNKNVYISVFTNGTLINADYVEFFKTYPPDMIQISLYGSSEEAYMNLTGHKGFEKAVSAISALQEAGLDVRVAVTPSKYMRDDYIDIMKLCKEKKFYIENQEVFLLPNREDPTKNDYYLTQEEIVDLSVRKMRLTCEPVPMDDAPDYFGDGSRAPNFGLQCKAGNCFAAVTWDGRMYPCYNAMVGEGPSLLEMSYAEAWKKTVKAASEVPQGAECVGCPYDNTCPKCPSFRLKDLSGNHCDPNACELTRKLVVAGARKLVPVD